MTDHIESERLTTPNQFALDDQSESRTFAPSFCQLQAVNTMLRIGGVEFERTVFGMLRQVAPLPFRYDVSYLRMQSTTTEMSYLRLGYLLAHVPYERLRTSAALELGPGKGVFFDVLKPHVSLLHGFDAVSDSAYHTINWDEAINRNWDVVFAFDVLEHFQDIHRLWDLRFEYGVFSLPAPPVQGVSTEWRHFKPNEHIWHITADQFSRWVCASGYDVIASGSPEDCIRQRWSDDQPNINSFIIRRRG